MAKKQNAAQKLLDEIQTTVNGNGHSGTNRVGDALATTGSPATARKVVGTSQPAGTIVIPEHTVAEIVLLCVGTSPLIIHNWGIKQLRQMALKVLGFAPEERAPKNPEEEYNAARYVSTEGWDGIASKAFKASMVGACRMVKGIPMTMARRLFFTQWDGISTTKLEIGEHVFTMDTKVCRIIGEPQMDFSIMRVDNGSPDLRYRPKYFPWSVELAIQYNPNLITTSQLVQLCALAGRHEGVCEGRPGSPHYAAGEDGCWKVEGALG